MNKRKLKAVTKEKIDKVFELTGLSKEKLESTRKQLCIYASHIYIEPTV